MGASVVACGDASPVREPGEEVFNFVAGAVEILVIGQRRLAASR